MRCHTHDSSRNNFCMKFMFCWCCSLKTVILCANNACTNTVYSCIHVLNLKKKAHVIFPTTMSLTNACMELVGFNA